MWCQSGGRAGWQTAVNASCVGMPRCAGLRSSDAALASVVGRRGRLAAQLPELAGPQVAGDEPALCLGLRQEVDVDLVGAQLCAALADARQVEGRCVALA